MSDKKKTYADGIYFNMPRENAPAFVLGSISIRAEQFAEWLSKQEPDARGYVRLSVLAGKEKPYITLDTYRPIQQKEENFEF